ncbi:hypothetical protein [Micromonospora zhanjiangensis]|uniref:Uncharacterized protein n=1 Tax=Micromonospora zhanjiangensis TaxID=1522057 RepID=A0ABV8KEG3_9ACTN
MATETGAELIEFGEISAEEQQGMLERAARSLLNLTAAEFRQRWEAGLYKEDEDPRVTQVAMLLP